MAGGGGGAGGGQPATSAFPTGTDTSDRQWYLDAPINEPQIGTFVSPADGAAEKPSGMNHSFAINRNNRFGFNDPETGTRQQPRILRGYIRPLNYKDITGDESKPLRLHFMWNPGVVRTSYAVNATEFDPDQQNDVQTGADGGVSPSSGPGFQDFSFEFTFDRQLEVARKQPTGGSEVETRGVLHDVDVFERITAKQGVNLTARRITVVFSPLLMVSGWITQTTLNYTKFAMNFVPTVCEFSVNMTIWYIGAYRPPEYVADRLMSTLTVQQLQNIPETGSLGAVLALPPDNFTLDNSRTGGQPTAQPPTAWDVASGIAKPIVGLPINVNPSTGAVS